MHAMKRWAVAIVLVVLTGCGGEDFLGPEDFEFGRLDVYVRDTDQQPINGVAVKLNRPGGQTEDAGGATGSVGLPGYYFFLKTSGQFDVVITVPDGYSLAPDQQTARRIEFAKNQQQTVTFVLRRN